MWSRKPALSWLDRLRSSKGIPVTTDLNLEQFLNQNPNSSSDSVSIPKQIQPKSKSKPGQESWLDRLRSSKGIPVTTDLNLEQFLNQNPNSSSDSVSIPKQIQPKSKSKPGQESEQLDKEPEWFNPTSSVPAELSVMEDKSNKSHQFIPKKRSRKQINPKICVSSSSVASVAGAGAGAGGGAVGVRGGGGVGIMSPSSGDNSVLDEEEDEGCSWSDCVVIDTSNVEWKSENMVIRRGNVWKVREKNLVLKKVLPMRKKRKAKKIDNDDDDDYDIKDEKKKKKNKKKNKKTKQKVSPVRSTSISNKEDDDQCPVLPFEGSPVNNNQISIRRTHPNLDQAPTKRCKFLSLSANLGKKRFAPYL